MLTIKTEDFNLEDLLNGHIDNILDESLAKANNIMQMAVKNVEAIDFGDLVKGSIVEIDKQKKSFLFYTNLPNSQRSRHDYSGLIINGEGSSQTYGERDFPKFASLNLKQYLETGDVKEIFMPGAIKKINKNF